jgi:poly-gamma-glutamate synthesis protein (capsule biosynthesis protein)
LKFLFCGDIVVKHPEKLRISKNLSDIIISHDIRCCNFEAPIVDKCNNLSALIKTGPNIFQSSISAEKVVDAGFNLVTIANNHVMDYGAKGLTQTKEYFGKCNIPAIGAGFSFEAVYAPLLFTDENGKNIGIIALAEAGFGVYKSYNTSCGYAWIHHPEVFRIIQKLKEKVNLLIIVVHAGLEDAVIPLPEWQACYRFFVDIGADMVIASHPHIVQGYETYHGKMIFYSLGNFYFDDDKMRNDTEWNRSIIVSFDTNQIDNIKQIPVSVKNTMLGVDDSIDFRNDIEARATYLNNKLELEQMADRLAIRLWKQYYKSYYENILYSKNIDGMSLHSIAKYTLRRLFDIKPGGGGVDTVNETFLLHNIQIESHRWLVERYLHNKNIRANQTVNSNFTTNSQ